MASFSRVSQIKYVIFVCLSLISKFKGLETNYIMPDYASSCPLPSFSSAPKIKYDVFVSFTGPDARQGFLSHLEKALSRKQQIVTFVDYKIQRGDQVSPALLSAIETSLISLVIFSQNYASSRWCLDELVKIVECRERDGQIVLPVFYDVDPSEVRHQKGTYGNAFAEHGKKYSTTRVQIWRSALEDSANISGFELSKFRDDADLIEKIVEWVLMKLSHMHQVNSKGLLGIDKSIEHLESLLQQGSGDVRVIGIWGMGGIGKTTIAEEVFNRQYSKYEACCFLAKVREESKRNGIISLKKKLFSILLDEDLKIETLNGLPQHVERRLGRMKVLVVLDEVRDSEQLEILVGGHDRFGSGSRIIITTRDKQILAKEVDDIYKVEPLDFDESLQLFNLNAFKQNRLEMEYYELAKRMVNYANGNPLVLKVLGRHFRERDKKIWESQLKKIKKLPSKEVHGVMRMSYDDLEREEQKIFLDIACFLYGLNLKVDSLTILLRDRDYSVGAALERLQDKCLITISEENTVSMHDIIQEMAWEIVHQESKEDPGKQSHLRDPDNIYQVLDNNKGTGAIRSITANMTAIKELQLSPRVFAKMSNLRFLDFYNQGYHQRGSFLPQGLESLPDDLRYLRWMHFPLKSLPTKFYTEKLVILDLSHSRMEKLWRVVKNLGSLKHVDLSASELLMELPDFSMAKNLQVLKLGECRRLVRVHPSVFYLDKLEMLDLSRCTALTSLRSNIPLSSLRYLTLRGSIRLREFSVTSENMIELDLHWTSIKELPSSMGHESKLEKLLLAHTGIKNLPASIKNLTSLRHLDLHDCTKLRTLAELPPSLEKLDAGDCTSLETVMFPSTAVEQLRENRKSVVFWNCLKLAKHSLRNIGLNAQINIMKFAYRHLSALGPDSDYDYFKDYDAEATYVYPGRRVPEWLMYRTTTEDYITVDLSSASHSPQLGFVFCFVVPQVTSSGLRLKFSISNGEGEGNSINMYVDRPHDKITSEHVCLMYDPRCSRYLNSRARNQPMIKIKVSALTSNNVPVLLKGFGVSPVNGSEYHNFIQQIAVGDYHYIPNISTPFNNSNLKIPPMGHVENTSTLMEDVVSCLFVCILYQLFRNYI